MRDSTKQSLFILLLGGSGGVMGALRLVNGNIPIKTRLLASLVNFLSNQLQKVPLLNQTLWKNSLLMASGGVGVSMLLLMWSNFMHKETLHKTTILEVKNSELEGSYKTTLEQLHARERELKVLQQQQVTEIKESERLKQRNADLIVENTRLKRNSTDLDNVSPLFMGKPRKKLEIEKTESQAKANFVKQNSLEFQST